MNTEQSAGNIGRHRDELLRLACDQRDVARASPDLRELLSDDPKLRTELEETGELVRELRDALRPQPLPETLLRRIHARLDEQADAGRPIVLQHFRLVGLAAAAALALAAIGPLTSPHTPREAPMPLALSAADAADIVEAWAMYRWDGHLAYSIERVSAELTEVDQQMDRAAGVCTGLPWGPEDDWDLPPDEDDAAVPPATPPICRDAAPTGRRVLAVCHETVAPDLRVRRIATGRFPDAGLGGPALLESGLRGLLRRYAGDGCAARSGPVRSGMGGEPTGWNVTRNRAFAGVTT